MAMSNLRYLATTTILGLALSYGLHQYHGEENIRTTDCSVYKQGKGLDVNGKPFEVKYSVKLDNRVEETYEYNDIRKYYWSTLAQPQLKLNSAWAVAKVATKTD